MSSHLTLPWDIRENRDGGRSDQVEKVDANHPRAILVAAQPIETVHNQYLTRAAWTCDGAPMKHVAASVRKV